MRSGARSHSTEAGWACVRAPQNPLVDAGLATREDATEDGDRRDGPRSVKAISSRDTSLDKTAPARQMIIDSIPRMGTPVKHI